jgi:hypothetical protein
MERYSIQMFTSAWARYYAASVKGSWIPNMGTWLRGTWLPSTNVLVAASIINPSPMFLLVQERTREVALSVEIHYKTAAISSWVQEIRNGFRQDFPVYVFDEDKECTVVVPAYTDPETIYMLPDNNMYQIDSVVVTGGAGRNQEKFSILALASPSPRILYGLGANDLQQNLLRVKRGLFPQPEFCMTCMGTKEYPEGTTCPECEGYGFAGPNAVYPLLDFHGRNVSLPRYGAEADEAYGRRIWARKWNVIPTKSEIERYFTHFMHIMDPLDLLVWEHPDDDEPLFWVAAYYGGLGTGALWQQGDANQDYDGVVERACPAGVNGYFAWLAHGGGGYDGDAGDGSGDELIVTDDSSSQEWDLEGDLYGPLWEGSEWLEALWDEFGGWSSENLLDDFEGYDDGDDIAAEAPAKWTEVSGAWEAETGMAGLLKATPVLESGVETFEDDVHDPDLAEDTSIDDVVGPLGTWNKVSGDATCLVHVDSGNKVLEIVDDTDAHSCTLDLPWSSHIHPNGMDWLSFKMKVASHSGTNLIYLAWGVDDYTYPGGGRRIQLQFRNDGTIYCYHAGSWENTGKTFAHDASWNSIKILLFSLSSFKISTDGGASWSGECSLATDFGGAGETLNIMDIVSSGDGTSTIYYDDWTSSAIYVAPGCDDGEAMGTFPVISGTTFDGYEVKFKATVPDDTAAPLEVQLTENGKTATADVRARVVFDPSDHLVYVLDSGGTPVSTGLAWTQDMEEEWAICIVSSTEVRIGKLGDYWGWSEVMECRNTWTAGIKYFIALSDDLVGALLDDITYAW